MKIFIQIATSFVLALWPILMMTSVMIFDAPGSTDNRKAILMALSLCFIPTMIGLLYFIFNQTFWTIKPKIFLIIMILVSIAASFIFGYPKLLLNNTKGISSNGYFLHENKVYYEGNLTEAVSSSFQKIDQYGLYARDAEAVFYRGRKIEGLKSRSFVQVATNANYFTDGTSIFYEGKILVGSDAATFVQLKINDGPSSYFKDKNAVYAFGRKIEGVKPDSVKILDEAYLVDSENAFYYKEKIVGADPTTFEAIPNHDGWAKDKKAVYVQNIGHPDVDAATLEILERGYAKDKSKVYYRDGSNLLNVVGANPARFRVTNWDPESKSEATDGAHYYLDGKQK